jgi:hypothetical protein
LFRTFTYIWNHFDTYDALCAKHLLLDGECCKTIQL